MSSGCSLPQPARRAVTLPSRLNLMNIREWTRVASVSIGFSEVIGRRTSNLVITRCISVATASSISSLRPRGEDELLAMERALMSGISSKEWVGGVSTGSKERRFAMPGGLID